MYQNLSLLQSLKSHSYFLLETSLSHLRSLTTGLAATEFSTLCSFPCTVPRCILFSVLPELCPHSWPSCPSQSPSQVCLSWPCALHGPGTSAEASSPALSLPLILLLCLDHLRSPFTFSGTFQGNHHPHPAQPCCSWLGAHPPCSCCALAHLPSINITDHQCCSFSAETFCGALTVLSWLLNSFKNSQFF